MSRKLGSKAIEELAQLTRARKLLAEGELARHSAMLKSVEEDIRRLRTQSFDVDTPADAAVLERWERWRAVELKHLLQRKAVIAAEHRNAVTKFGRLMAEHDVVKNLGTKASKQEASLRQRRTHIS